MISVSSAFFPGTVFASGTANGRQGGTRLNISRQRIAGARANFYLAIPSFWLDRVNVERARISDDAPYVEKLNFYYEFGVFRSRPLLMASLYVYDRFEWTDDSGFLLVMKAQRHYFEAEIFDNRESFNESGRETDRWMYERCFAELSTPFRIKSLIELPIGYEEIVENTVFVNGRELETKVMIDGGNRLVPLRETAEMLGYLIRWIANESAVEIVGEGVRDRFIVRGSMQRDGRGYAMRLVGGVTYVSTAYFFRVLGRSVDVDSFDNVRIY